MATIAEALNLAVQYHTAGRLPEAEGIYRQILDANPSHPDALHLLGVLAHQVGRHDVAVDFIGKAIAAKPRFPEAHCNLGSAFKGLGRLDDAVVSYRKAISQKHTYADAHYNLGNVLADLGRLEEAVAAHRKAIAFDRAHVNAHNNLGNVLLALGRVDEAVAAYRKTIALDSGFATAHANLGHALVRGAADTDRLRAAVAAYDGALAVAPDHADAHNGRGYALQRLGMTDDAVTAYGAAISCKPDGVEAYVNLGNTFKDLGRFEEAVACFRDAVVHRPDFALTHTNLGNTLRDMGRMDDAEASYRTAIALAPDDADAHNGLGSTLYQQDRPQEALEHYRTALSLRPAMAEAHGNIAVIHKMMGRTDQALAEFDRALALTPDLADAHENMAYALLVAGRLKPAWEHYEWRWKGPKAFRKRPFAQPWWAGEPLDGKTLLVWGEQGLGDEILGFSMFPEALSRAGRCVAECDPRLVDLFARSFPAASFVARTTPPDPRTQEADFQIPAFGLARLFRNEPADFPRHHGYLTADPAKVEHWRAWLATLGPGMKVGISWRGRLPNKERSRHFASLERMAVVLGVPGVVFVNLQYDHYADDIDIMRRLTGVPIHSPEGIDLTNDLDDVAALTSALDAIVGPATAVGYLAGALGRPTWLHAYYPVSNEKELCAFDHVPWCPSIHVETCGFDEDWANALTPIAAALRGFVAAGAP